MEELFQINGSSEIDLSAEVDDILTRQRLDRLKKKYAAIASVKKNYTEAHASEAGKTYTICVPFEGDEKFVKAEFLGRGRNQFSHFVFFRQLTKGGNVFVHGILNYHLVKEEVYEYRERE